MNRIRILNRVLTIVICLAVSLIAPEVWAAKLSLKDREAMALRIKKNAGIYVDAYDKASDTYEIRIENESDVGPNITTPEWLLEGIDGDMSLEALKRNPKSVVGSYFRLKKRLWLLAEDEVEARKQVHNNTKRRLPKESAR